MSSNEQSINKASSHPKIGQRASRILHVGYMIKEPPSNQQNGRRSSQRRHVGYMLKELPPLQLPPLQLDELSDHSAEAACKPTPITTEAYSVFTTNQKRWIIIAGSLAAFLSPLAGSIYFPALSTIAEDLHVSDSQISLTVTTYLIVQGLAPMMVAGFSDRAGRRPGYFICLVIFIASNIGLCLQNSYPALLILRCIQSAGSSGTSALSSGIVGDLVTNEERGKFLAFASIGSMLGTTVSPIIGGLISDYLDWHWLFWFLLFLSWSFVPLLLVLPETCRKVVGDGSIPPPMWNMSLIDYFRHRNRAKAGIIFDAKKQQELRANYGLHFPNPLSTLAVLTEKGSGLVLLATALGFAPYYAISSAASAQFKATYGFNNLQVGTVFLAIGAGNALSAFTTGALVDSNYRRHAKMHGLSLARNKQPDLSNFPIERARLEIGLPMMFTGTVSIIVYGWIMNHNVSLAVPLLLMFLTGYCLMGANQILNILIVDIYPGSPAAAAAANSLVRNELGAAAAAAIIPAIGAVGSGWAFTFLAFLFVASTPSLFAIMAYGIEFRREKKEKEDRKAAQKMIK